MQNHDIRFNWYGWMNPWSGYGKANLEWSTALERQTNGGVTIGWERRTKKDDPALWDDLTLEQRKLILKPFKKQKLSIIKTTPDIFERSESEYRVGFTMVENTKMAKDWVDMCNKMDHIFVPNELLVDVFKDSGVTVPISQVRQGYNPEQYRFYERPKNKSVFTFGLAGWLDERKNWEDVVRAFVSEFDKNEPVRLILKNTCPDFGYWMPNDERIKIVDRVFTREEMIRFYEILDCFMFVSRAEGTGLPVREAMATGLPVILTNYSGLAEVCDNRYNYPIDPVAIDYPDKRPQQPGFMARLDIQEIMYWMRYVYEHQDEARAKGKAAAEEMLRNWTWDACALDMLEVIKRDIPSKYLG